ncbi:hypothetical protein GCM10010277_71850 [Streptomyces longisporoflavus]|uniref:hypothetical protein n=1 Tax=Streptomyces longisporoflavus TaxID=28044 RepID=UPI00167E0CF8|nr:hypothetical protein [Streptomyces longisporoflavus]GGV64945.1 hypothetical protein GCM10010277_71850 [Streptomyces longisporoflavus]
MTIGLLSTMTAMLYGGTVSILALTATFARRRSLRREARRTLAVLVPGRVVEVQQAAAGATGGSGSSTGN